MGILAAPSPSFETFGNASIQVLVDGAPLLVTDPWLGGKVYFGSWALDHPPHAGQIENAQRSPFVWFSHGHPDHLHPDSVRRLRPEHQLALLPDHYSDEIQRYLEQLGFRVELLRYRRWRQLAPGVRVQCLQHANQDAMLLIELGDSLLIDRNDCPLHGEKAYLRRVARRYRRVYLTSLCAVESDMVNVFDAAGRRTLASPEEVKPGAIWEIGDLCRDLGVGHFCCSSSQHLYCRGDSAWANPYRIAYADMRRWWPADDVELIGPYATVDPGTGRVVQNHPSFESDWSQVGPGTDGDRWDEPMTEADWAALEAFFTRFELLPRHLDFVRFTVAGETRTLELRPADARRPAQRRRGVCFEAPRRSLVETVASGYFDDLLVGNFVRTELVNLRSLYPHFTPVVAKLGGMARVHTRSEHRRFVWHYLRLSPRVFLSDRCHDLWLQRLKPRLRTALRRVGALEGAKRLGRRLRGLPPLPPRDG